VVLLAGVVILSVLNAGELERFGRLVGQAQPQWLLVAFAAQLATYPCAGTIWGRVAAAAGHRLSGPSLARLSVERLTLDQLIPVGGMAGDVVLVRAMTRMGLPSSVGTEALLIDTLSYNAAFAGLCILATAALWLRHDVTPVLVGLLAACTVLSAAVPLGIRWLLGHRDWRPGRWLGRIGPLLRVLQAVDAVSPDRVWNPGLLASSVALQLAIFGLDSSTLWAMLRALGMNVPLETAFIATVIATMAGTLSLLPGGIGSFEAGATATLVLLGVPVEGALTATLLMRGLTLWLPLVPGVILARRDLGSGGADASTVRTSHEQRQGGTGRLDRRD
jgi:uncharacterized membrane protein YbhN (UPF0104 family)